MTNLFGSQGKVVFLSVNR